MLKFLIFIFGVILGIQAIGQTQLQILPIGDTPNYTLFTSNLPLEFTVTSQNGPDCFRNIPRGSEFAQMLIVTGDDAIHVIPKKINDSMLKITVLFIKNKKLMQIAVLDDISLGPDHIFNFYLYAKFVMSAGKYQIYNSRAADDNGVNHYGVAFYQYNQDACSLMLNFKGDIAGNANWRQKGQ